MLLLLLLSSCSSSDESTSRDGGVCPDEGDVRVERRSAGPRDVLTIESRCSTGGKASAAVGAISRNKLRISSWLFDVYGGSGQNPNKYSPRGMVKSSTITHVWIPLSSPSISFQASLGSLSASEAKPLRMLCSALTLDDTASPASADSSLRAASIVGCTTSRMIVQPRWATSTSESSLSGVVAEAGVAWLDEGNRDRAFFVESALRREREPSRDDELV